MASRVVGAGWTEQAHGNLWTPITSDLPSGGRVVEVWWLNSIQRATYDHTAHEWRMASGTVLSDITHWRMIRE